MTQPAVISLHNAQRTYTLGGSTIHALDGVDLEIERGTFLSIVGASGSGKSTLLHVLGLLDILSEGELTLGSWELSKSNDDDRSRMRNRSIGFVFQKFNLLSDLTVLENIALPLAYSGIPKERRQEKAIEVANKVGLGDRLEHRPTQLSGGQAQRVAIARALVNDPELIMADEPTGALDSKTSREIIDLFLELNREGRTIVMVTHDRDLATEGTRRITISDGIIVEDENLKPVSKDSNQQEKKHKNDGLDFKDLLHIGIHEGLLAHKLRTFLTMLGVIIGVASVISMSSFSEGSRKKQADQIRALGSNLVKVIDRRLDGEELNDARVRGSLGLSRSDAEAIKSQLPSILHLAMTRKVSMTAFSVNGSLPVDLGIYGAKGNLLEVNNLQLMEGRWFSQEEQISMARVAVIGARVARGLREDTSGESPLGKILVLGGQPYRITGILNDRQIDTGELEIHQATDANLHVYLPLDTVLGALQKRNLRSELDEIHLQLKDENALVEAGISIRRLISHLHQGVEDFTLFVPLDILKAKQQSQKLLSVLSLGICAISLLVGGIGIMNIMLASVSERMKEIGIRRALGATRRNIRDQFLCEATLISFAGSLVGILLAMAGILLVCPLLNLPIVFSIPVITLAILLAIATGAGFGYAPANRAAHQNVIEILRDE
jgi:macrolide transport system ATP-binding/permease protein